MRVKIALIILLFGYNIYADDSDIFEDAQLEFEPQFEDDDDIKDIETGSKISLTTDKNHDSLNTTNYNYFSERDVQRSERSLSIFSGNDVIARVFHINIFPQGHFKVWKTQGHIGIPLRFPVYDNILKSRQSSSRQKGFVNGSTFIAPRSQDFRTFFDAQRIIRHFEIGSEDDPYALKLSRSSAYTLGQGDLMKDLVSDGLYDQDYLFANGHASLDRVRLEGVIGPMIKPHIVGLNANFQPFSSFETIEFVRDMSFDVSYVGDYFAPLGPVAKQEDAFVLNRERRLLLREEGNAQAFSTAVKSEYYATPWFSMTPYLSYSHLFLNQLEGNDTTKDLNSYGTGLALGHQFSFYLSPNKKDSILYFKTEGRVFSSHFQPNYFGDNYLLDRQSFKENTVTPISKAEYVGFDPNDSARLGYLFELGYALNQIINTKVAYEDAHTKTNQTVDPMRKIRWITGLTIHELMSVYLGYQATSINRMNELFDFNKSRGLLSLRGQIKLMRYLYFDAWLKHSFGINDMYEASKVQEGSSTAQWLSNAGETRSLNFGLGVELAMTF